MVGQAAPSAPATTPFIEEDAGQGFAWTMTLGVVSALFGIVVLIWPDVTVRVYAVLLGIWLLVAGAVRIVGAFGPGRGLARRVLSGIVGVVLFLGGAACLRDVAKGVVVLAFVIAVTWLLSGVAWWVLALQASGAARRWLVVLAVVSLALGLAFLLWPDLSLTLLVWLTGLGSLAVGVVEITFAVALRRDASPGRARAA